MSKDHIAANGRERKRAWRVGTKVPANLYRDDVIAGQCQSPEIAAEIVAGMQQAARVRELEIQVANLTPEKCPVCGNDGCSNCRIELAAKRVRELEVAIEAAPHARGCGYLGKEDLLATDWELVDA